jgi:ABC-type glycerol-3-phosphate transport system permease component
MKKTWKSELPKHVFIWGIILIAFFPMYLMLCISLKTNSQFMMSPWYPFPPFHFENWAFAWGIVKNYIFNTIFVAVTTVGFTFCFTLPAAFFFARYKLPFSNILWYAFLLLMLMPGIANIVPLFMLLKQLHLLNSLFALILVGITGAQVVQIYILRNFIEDIPNDLFEAAEIDGAGPIKQIFHVVLPMSGSIISTLAILQFMGAWNDFILPMIIIRDDSLLTLAAGLVKLDGEYVKMWGQMMAGYSIASIPLVLIFIFTMRLFVRGLSAGAVKG